MLSEDNVQPANDCNGSFAVICTVTDWLVWAVVLYLIVDTGASVSILETLTVTFFSLPAKSRIMTSSFAFFENVFDKFNLSEDKNHPSDCCKASFEVITAITKFFVIVLTLYTTSAFGATLSILETLTSTFEVFPAVSETVTVSVLFVEYFFVKTKLSFDNVQPSSFWRASLDVIDTVTSLFVFNVVL